MEELTCICSPKAILGKSKTSNAEQERFLEAHEYRERTCAVTGVEYDKTMGACFALSCGHSTWHDGEGNAPNFCQDCGAKVNHRGATDREVSG